MIIICKGFNLETKTFKISKYKDFLKVKNTPNLNNSLKKNLVLTLKEKENR